jgi:hypothetical protein
MAVARKPSKLGHARTREKEIGMGRFFSPINLDRYRRLASGVLDEAERHQVLEDLAGEMNAFKREAGPVGVSEGRAADGGCDPGIGGQR